MVENLFKLSCLMFVCFIAFAYLLVAVENKATATFLYVVPAETSAVAEKKKACGCCAERMERVRKKLQQARERRQTEQQVVNTQPL